MNNNFEKHIMELAKAISELHRRAVVAYTPLVNDICSREATNDEVDHLLTWMFDFVVDEQMLQLFKQVCRKYIYKYPETIAFYILEYRKEFDRESLKGTEYEYLLEEDKEFIDE